MPEATLKILPWVRQGLTSAIDNPDRFGPEPPARASIAPTVSLNGNAAGMTVQLYGPADVASIDARQIIRTEPVPGTANFEPNYFPLIEFDRPDFPWLFTPLSANAESKLRPWLCLVTVKKQPGVTFTSPPGGSLPVLEIASPANASHELPPLQDSWAWAHSQAVPVDPSSPASLADAIDRQPERSLSRLICARVLEPNADYMACLVPTFELGRRAGLAVPIREVDLDGPLALAPAWGDSTSTEPVRLPVYHHWEFRTGSEGDFESLVRRLRPAVIPGLGLREVDISQPGFDAGTASTVRLQGALMPFVAPPDDELPLLPAAFKDALISIVNSPYANRTTAPTSDVTLAPPLYGGVHAGKASITATGPTTWVDQLNADPRWRVAAALGTGVVQHHQQALLAAAWEQAGDVSIANQQQRQMELSAAANQSFLRRHLSAMTEEQLTRFAAPAFANLVGPLGESMRATQAASRLPLEANGFALRRLGRLRGPLTRKVVSNGRSRSASTSWVAQLNNPADPIKTSRPPAPPPKMCGFAELPDTELAVASQYGVFLVAAEGAPPTQLSAALRIAGAVELPGHFRAAARAHLALAFPTRSSRAAQSRSPLEGVRAAVLQQAAAPGAIASLARSSIAATANTQRMLSSANSASGLEAMLLTPKFEQPMSDALVEFRPEWLLPGIDGVGPDTVVGLRTNSRFIDAFMVGLNHEMSRELLWHGFPADLRSTYFAKFWPSAADDDMPDIHTWGTRALGQRTVGETDVFVMLMRSALLQKYPNAIVYLAPARSTGAAMTPGQREPVPGQVMPPLLVGRALSDITYFGFGVSPAQASGTDGRGGYFVVIEEQVSAPRFGVDVYTGSDPEQGPVPGQYLAVGESAPSWITLPSDPPTRIEWGKNSAHMAAITRQQPVRIAIHASALV
jgi:hypothetical protein